MSPEAIQVPAEKNKDECAHEINICAKGDLARIRGLRMNTINTELNGSERRIGGYLSDEGRWTLHLIEEIKQ